MIRWIQNFLQIIAAMTIAPTVPAGGDALWKADLHWVADGTLLVFRAESEQIVKECKANPKASLQTPLMTVGGHELYLDGKLIASVGDRSYQRAFRVYNSLVVPCEKIADGHVVRWEAFTASHVLAHLKEYPRIVEHRAWLSFFGSTAFILVSGALFALSLIFLITFKGKISKEFVVSFFVGGVANSISFACYNPAAFMINAEPLIVQKVSDCALWIGVIFTCRVFFLLGDFPRSVYKILVGFCAFGMSIICLSATLDQEQLGSNVAMLGGTIFLLTVLSKGRGLGWAELSLRNNRTLQILAAVSYGMAGLNDTLFYQGLIATIPMFPFGMLSLTVLLGLAVNEQIVKTYDERDYLRANLEKEVEIKTEALRNKSEELQRVLDSLRMAQADLIQSEKLASLGTLSAGIAHEINNSLNYTNGSIVPLQKILSKETLTEADRSKASKLLKLMEEGLCLTFKIISNLKAHTRPSSGQAELLPLREVADGVLLLLKSKLSFGVKVEVEIDPGLQIKTERVSLSQILMNLISNAIDAIKDGQSKGLVPEPAIRLAAGETEEEIWLSVADTGPGIPPEIQGKIFDPFFTTKSVGKGTGLGLHIVFSEMKKHAGRVEVASRPGEGAKFILHYPKSAETGSQGEAAA